MGNVTSGENNDDLVDILKILGYIKTKKVERIFRAVDRGDYVLPSHRNEAYKDLSWKIGNIHLSAPCIYSKVMEGLSLEPGLSFLNIGSGTGYLSTMAGLILSHHGTNHGIELNSDCMEYAYEKLEEFKQKSLALDEFDFCEPVFMQGNCLKLEFTRKYDRVYCGAACPESHEAFIKQFVKIGGVLVMPYKDHLLRIERVDTDSWKHKVMLPVLFAPLIMPTCNSTNNSRDHHDNTNDDKVNDDNLSDCHNSSFLLPFSEPLSLQELCRCEIRCQLRKNIWTEHPVLETKYPITGANKTGSNSFSSSAQSTLQRCIVPLYDESSDNSRYITLNDDYDDDDDEDDDEDNEDNNDNEDNVDNNNDDDNDDDDVNNKDRSSKIRHRRNRRTRLFFCLEPSRLEDELNEEEEEEEDEDEDDNDDGDDDDDKIEQVTSFRVLKNVSPEKSMLNIFNLDKSTINNDDKNKTKDEELSGNAFQPSTSQYLSQGCSNNDNNQENSNDILFTSAKESLDSLPCHSNSQINNDNQADEETMDVDKEQQEPAYENFQVVDGTESSVLNSSTSTNNIENGITNADNNGATFNTACYEAALGDIDNDDDNSMVWLNSIKPRHQQKNKKWGISDHLNSAESHPSLSKRSKVNDSDNNDDNSRENRQQPRVCAYNVDVASLSSHMKTKISQLPLPVSLRLYVNYNRFL